jgi:hypothetical protein
MFGSTSDLDVSETLVPQSSRRNRGDPDVWLFLMNHRVSASDAAPDPAIAVDVSRRDVIVVRARACQRERRLMPNYVAVDFYGVGT